MNPLFKASLTSGSFFVAGDLINHHIYRHFKTIDTDAKPSYTNQIPITIFGGEYDRILGFGLIGALVHAPFFYSANRLLATLGPVSSHFTQTKVAGVLLPVLRTHILTFVPWSVCFLGVSGLMYSSDAIQNIKDRIVGMNTSGALWFIGMGIVGSLSRRAMLVKTTAGIGWSSWTSHVTFGPASEKKAERGIEYISRGEQGSLLNQR